ncbi:MAG TPA: Na+/H+ antiporter subunit G, partial [Rhodobacteraceae bacterium]|nr:Na+/H+ antiporter subunit G [Paracoccaceae bacterium]
MSAIVAGILLLAGALFSIAAGVGLVRLPDVYIRMHAA